MEMAGVHGALRTGGVGDGRDWVPLDSDESEGESKIAAQKRRTTGMGELDRVLGGGMCRQLCAPGW